ncbi:c-type cytochrome [Propionivibrio sp.]|uniref:c-type cytochrome n=1 Tax=Propionivibrio sp. TaxID=2212460 RepID=UPI003BF438B0
MIRTTALAVLMTASFSVFAVEEAKSKPDLAKAKQIASTVCVACHGVDGNSPSPVNPILAAQGSEYLLKQLIEFKSVDGKPALRNNPIMAGMTAALTLEDMQGLALYFSQQKQKPASALDATQVAAGKILWRKGDFERGVPACAGCHGPAAAGVPAQFPRLAGQYPEYIDLQLKNFRIGERSNDPAMMMRNVAEKLSDKQIKALADFSASMR